MRRAKRKAIANLFDRVDPDDSDLDKELISGEQDEEIRQLLAECHDGQLGQLPRLDDDEEGNGTDDDGPEDDDHENAFTSTRDIWKKITFEPDIKEFDLLDSPPDELPSEIEVWKMFMTQEILQMICNQSNVYAFQKNTELLQLCPKELEIFCGIFYRMGIVKMSCVRDYWSERMRYAPVADEMSRNRFEQITRKIHFVDNE